MFTIIFSSDQHRRRILPRKRHFPNLAARRDGYARQRPGHDIVLPNILRVNNNVVSFFARLFRIVRRLPAPELLLHGAARIRIVERRDLVGFPDLIENLLRQRGIDRDLAVELFADEIVLFRRFGPLRPIGNIHIRINRE